MAKYHLKIHCFRVTYNQAKVFQDLHFEHMLKFILNLLRAM